VIARMENGFRFGLAGVVLATVGGLFLSVGIAGDAPKIFRSQDGAFQFRYAPELVRCDTQDAKVTSGSAWAPVDACKCNDLGGVAVTAVCFAYPKEKFKDKPAFNGASFFVATDATAMDPQSCLAGSATWGT
jgi:hypothetical protein